MRVTSRRRRGCLSIVIATESDVIRGGAKIGPIEWPDDDGASVHVSDNSAVTQETGLACGVAIVRDRDGSAPHFDESDVEICKGACGKMQSNFTFTGEGAQGITTTK